MYQSCTFVTSTWHIPEVKLAGLLRQIRNIDSRQWIRQHELCSLVGRILHYALVGPLVFISAGCKYLRLYCGRHSRWWALKEQVSGVPRQAAKRLGHRPGAVTPFCRTCSSGTVSCSSHDLSCAYWFNNLCLDIWSVSFVIVAWHETQQNKLGV